MDKSVFGHAALALASSLTAYVAWTAPTLTDKDDAVLVIPGSADALSMIEWHDDTGQVTVQRENDGVTVTVTKAQPPTPPQTYPGTEQAKELFAKLAPLKAARDLGEVTAEKSKTFGLDNPKSKLVLHFGEAAHVVEVGGSTFGSGDSYARAADKKTYLLRSSLLSGLGHGALGLQDRDAVGLARSKFDRVVVTLPGGKRRDFSQRHGDDPGKAFLADPAEPDHKLEQASNWLDRVLRLRVTDLENQAPQGEPTLVVEFFNDKEAAGTLHIWQMGEKGALATSTHFKTPILLYKGSAETVLHDAEQVLAEGK